MSTEQRNGMIRRLVSLALTGLLGVAAFLAAETYRGIDRDLTDHDARINALEVQDAAQREAQKRIEETLSRIEAKVDRLQERRGKR